MKNLFQKVDMFYSLAMVGDRKSFLKKLAEPTITAEIANAAKNIAYKLRNPEAGATFDITELSPAIGDLQSADVGGNLSVVKSALEMVASATRDGGGSVYMDAASLLSKVTRMMNPPKHVAPKPVAKPMPAAAVAELSKFSPEQLAVVNQAKQLTDPKRLMRPEHADLKKSSDDLNGLYGTLTARKKQLEANLSLDYVNPYSTPEEQKLEAVDQKVKKSQMQAELESLNKSLSEVSALISKVFTVNNQMA